MGLKVALNVCAQKRVNSCELEKQRLLIMSPEKVKEIISFHRFITCMAIDTGFVIVYFSFFHCCFVPPHLSPCYAVRNDRNIFQP